MTAASAISTALAALCPPGTGCAAVALDGDLPPLWPGEALAIAAAVPRRRLEFAAGRAAARLALDGAGFPPAALPARADRCPDWPEGVRGSIAHSASIAIAAVGASSVWAGIGLDLEPEGQVEPGLASMVLRPEERGFGLDLTAAFCAKEAVQKAIFPACRELLEFHDLALRPSGDGFEAVLHRPLAAGACLRGLWTRARGHVVAAVFWPEIALRNSAPSFAASTFTS